MKWLLTFWTLAMGLIFWVPLPGGPPSPLSHADLLIHYGLFSGYGFILWEWIRPDRNRFYWIDWGMVLLIVAVMMETGQALVPGRTVNLLDYLANGLGGLSGGAIFLRRNIWLRTLGNTVFTGIFLFAGGSSDAKRKHAGHIPPRLESNVYRNNFRSRAVDRSGSGHDTPDSVVEHTIDPPAGTGSVSPAEPDRPFPRPTRYSDRRYQLFPALFDTFVWLQ